MMWCCTGQDMVVFDQIVSNDEAHARVKYDKVHNYFLSSTCKEWVVNEGLSRSIGVGQMYI